MERKQLVKDPKNYENEGRERENKIHSLSLTMFLHNLKPNILLSLFLVFNFTSFSFRLSLKSFGMSSNSKNLFQAFSTCTLRPENQKECLE